MYLEVTHAGPAARGVSAGRVAAAAAPGVLALISLVVFAAAMPQAPRLALLLHTGASVAAGRDFALGWLGAFALYAADALGGYAGAVALGAGALFATLAFVYLRSRGRAGIALSLGAALFTLLTCFDAARLGGSATGWLGAAAFLYVADRAPRRSAWLAPLVALLWCNASSAGVLAPLLAVLLAFGRALEARDVTAARPYWPIALASAAAVLLTPAGFGYPPQALAALHLDLQFARILPIAPGVAAPHVFRIVATLVVIAAAWLWGGKRRAVDAPLVFVAFVLCFFDGAFLPLLGIVAAPAFAAAARAQGEAVPACSRTETRAAGLAALCVVLAAAIALPRVPAAQYAAAAPRPLLERLAARGAAHVVFCSSLAWCDYAETIPGLRPFLDERVEAAAAGRLDAQEKIVRVRQGWREALRDQAVDAVLVARSSSLAQLVGLRSNWKEAGRDGETVLYVREGRAR